MNEGVFIGKLLTDKKGLTLAELLTALSILVLVAIPAGTMLLRGVQLLERQQVRLTVHQKARLAMSEVRENLLSASYASLLESSGVSPDGYYKVKKILIITEDLQPKELLMDQGKLLINRDIRARDVELEVIPIGIYQGMRLRVTAFSDQVGGGTGGRFSLVNEIYLRNAE